MESVQTILPEKYEWYQEQIAGHHPSVVKDGEHQIGIIKESGSNVLLKPVQEGVRGLCEIALYTEVNEAHERKISERDELLAKFGAFLPRYFGLKTIRVGTKEVECLIMEDLTYGYKQPCVMDIKMGRVTYDPNASEAKMKSESVKYPAQTVLGFRLLGYRMHPPQQGCTVKTRDKQWGRSRNLGNIVEAYGEFLSGRPGEEEIVAREGLSQLAQIRDWFNIQRIYHFYASSILIVYEACPDLPASVSVKLIDFSHAFPAHGNLDENYLFGLNNVITFIERFIDSLNRR